MSSPSLESRHVSARIHRPAPMVYAYAADPANLPAWAHGLSGSITREGDVWVAESPMGRVTVAFTPPNDLGVLDHDVTLPTGETFHNPFRILPDGPTTCEAVFTVRRPPGTSREDFSRDVSAVAADLNRLKDLLEAA